MPSDPTTMEFLIRAQAKLDEICEIAEQLGLEDKFLMIANVGVVHDHEDKFLIEWSSFFQKFAFNKIQFALISF